MRALTLDRDAEMAPPGEPSDSGLRNELSAALVGSGFVDETSDAVKRRRASSSLTSAGKSLI